MKLYKKILVIDFIVLLAAMILIALVKTDAIHIGQAANEDEGTSVSIDGNDVVAKGIEKEVDVPEENEKLIVIDPGHQGKGNREKEPIGPGAEEEKAKMASGTTGMATGVPEYEVTLQIGLKLREELENRGYRVVMTRESNDVNISNAERAQIANEADADAFIRVHVNGSEDAKINGAMAVCQTPSNPYNGDKYEQCKRLSVDVLESLVEATGCKKQSVVETDDMSGINWCTVPVTIIEVGYMSNKEEDQKLVADEYQNMIVFGIANGVDKYFEEIDRAGQSVPMLEEPLED